MDRAYEGNETRQLALAPGVYTRRATAQDFAARPMGIRPGDVQAAQRNRTLVSSFEGIPKNLLTLREARRDLPRVHPLRAHMRCTALV